VRARPLYLLGGEPVFCLFDDAPVRRDVAVLVLPPYGWDELCSYRSRRALARHLAAAGFPTLRLDLPGTGDSAGSPTDAARVTAWVDAARRAALWLRAETGAARVVAIGIGLGALVALTAADDVVDDLALWALPSSGRALARELRAVSLVERASNVPSDVPEALLNDSVVAPGGFLVSDETLRDLRALDPRPTHAAGRRVLLLGRDGSLDEQLVARVAAGGAEAETDPGRGYAAMLGDPADAQVPYATLAAIEAFVERGSGRGATCTPQAARVPAAVEVELEHDGALVRERALDVEHDGLHLPAIVTEPASASATPVAVVFLNGGAVRRIGHNRMTVDAARRWAARGITSLRVDLAGIGEADGGDRDYADIPALYAADLRTQVEAAIDRIDAPQVVVAGLCSGAYWAFQAALADTRVRGALMLNPRALFWERELEPTRHARRIRREIRSRRALRNLVRNGKPLIRARQLWQLTTGTAVAAKRVRGRSERARAVDAALARLRARGAQLVLLFSGGEGLREELEADGILDGDRVELTVNDLPGFDHTLRGVQMQAAAREAMDAALARLAAQPPP
jgi:alpha-beta hydrolase superfamily lysophospholipase